MKTQSIKLVLLSFLFLNISLLSFSQKDVDNDIIKQEREIAEFNEINLSGITKIFLNQGDFQKIVVEAKEEFQKNISTKVKNNKLEISTNVIDNKNYKIFVTVKDINEIQISGAAFIKSIGRIETPELKLIAGGAADVNLKIFADNLYSYLSGASDVVLSGNVNKHISTLSGAANLEASELISQETDIKASGASQAKVSAVKKLIKNVSGVAGVNSESNKVNVKINKSYSKSRKDNNLFVGENGDSTFLKVGNIEIEVIDGDSTKISFGNKLLEVSDDGNVNLRKINKKRKIKYRGHWAGFDIGVNGYLYDNDFSMPADYDYLDLKYEKSSFVNINFLEQNFNLYKNHLGLTTGLGLQFINYRFENNVILTHDNNKVSGYRDYNSLRDYSKSKLTISYFTIPLLLEYQTNRHSKSNSFHISAGMILATRIGSHTKVVYNDDGKHKDKDRDSFYLNPFKYDATVRIGWGDINMFATYSVNTLFKTDKGPEVYPFTVGLTLLSF